MVEQWGRWAGGEAVPSHCIVPMPSTQRVLQHPSFGMGALTRVGTLCHRLGCVGV